MANGHSVVRSKVRNADPRCCDSIPDSRHEIAFAEHRPFGVQAAKVLVAKSRPVNSAINPTAATLFNRPQEQIVRVFAHRDLHRSPTCDANTSRVTGMCAGSVNASRTNPDTLALSNSLMAIQERQVAVFEKKSTVHKLSCRRRQSTKTIAPMAPRTRSST